MPFGMELTELLGFFKQFGLAVAGASALWAFVFSRKDFHRGDSNDCLVFDWLSGRLFLPFLVGVCLTTLAWFVLISMMPVFAHEGIVVVPDKSDIYRALILVSPLYLILFLFSISGFLLKLSKPKMFYRFLSEFYAIAFILIFAIISMPAWRGFFDNIQWFFVGHAFHSIFTLGTVVVLDFLFLISKSAPILKQHIYPLFSPLSVVIIAGLGVDFLSVVLIFPEAFVATEKFFFMQTVVSILIINGVFLAGIVGRKLLSSVSRGGHPPSRKWMLIGDICGTISIGSWTTITFVDSFRNLSLNYGELFLIYVTMLALGLFINLLWVYFHRDDALSMIRLN